MSEGQQTVQLRERNTRSCVECSRRKVRCDRQSPCNNCVRTETPCSFPKFRKRPVKRQKEAGSQEERRSSVLPPANGNQSVDESSLPEHAPTMATPNSSRDGSHLEKRSSVASAGLYDRIADQREEPTWLVRQQNKSRYISNSFWASMTREVKSTLRH